MQIWTDIVVLEVWIICGNACCGPFHAMHTAGEDARIGREMGSTQKIENEPPPDPEHTVAAADGA